MNTSEVIVELFAVDGLKEEEIARIVGCSLLHVHNVLHDHGL